MKFQVPELKFSKTFPKTTGLSPKSSILIYDQILSKSPNANAWIQKFPFRYAVTSGEELKDLKNFPAHMEKILNLSGEISERPLQIVCLGGGSVGDFSGFSASVLKRGVDFIQIPSTWLSAIDSAHGGKTALNVGNIKNQIGSFHSANKIYLIRELLISQPQERMDEALGEALKISLIQGKALWKKWEKIQVWNSENLWKLLPDLIKAKYQIVKRDPWEQKGIRHVLNFGHTLGHVFEAELGQAHGKAVLEGLRFAICWSEKKKILKSKSLLQSHFLPEIRNSLKSLQSPEKFLSQDKKRVANGKIRFIFLQSPGKPLIQSVTVSEVLDEVKRQAQ
ncbi:MAG: hypothetical protein ACAH59_09970 [Pseudobdellovibrionaceae bacterium]